ncbi:MAG: signal peptidase II [Acidobacteria bacterium]|nr:signal peptidase II [Acidobacteriota bacterium]
MRPDEPGQALPHGHGFPYLLVSLAVLAGDQASKVVAHARLRPLGTVPVIPGWFDLTFVANRGALFGLGREFGPALRTLAFAFLPAVAVVFLAALLWRSRRREAGFQGGLALILGGAAGNLLDRIRLGFVTDFLDFYWGTHHWPAFNLADASICVGVGLLGLDLLRDRRSASG